MIISTQDYSVFKTVLGNRNVNENRLVHLQNSILNKNLLHLHPIQVNEKMEVIDGQHRLEVAKRNKLSIFYIIEEGLTIKDAMAQNSNQWGWVNKEVLSLYSKLGYEDYILLSAFCETYDLPVVVSIKLLSGRSAATTYHHGKDNLQNDLMRSFKNGEFKIKDGILHSIEILASQLNEIKKYCPKQEWRTAAFISALQQTTAKVAFRKLLQKLETHKMMIKYGKNVNEYIRNFEDILNYRSMPGHRIHLLD